MCSIEINLLKATTVRALHPCDVCEGECETCIWAPFAPYRCDWCPDVCDLCETWASCEQCYEAHVEDAHPPHVPLPRVWWA